ncbi:uncharacterized protein E0L32_004187 [Thyridium curvatum]|uniref:Glycosyltransferase n=1 Tax=Thyridium curvatum TaxID=1093900 RepID=A0A507B1N4_9PEZI|nr:uncharacterized protein E0L32_004187 [Thyridium curvatum]TPX16192.1 hypothetical protein E0L32_004187 [Thyridium curvatum]
MRASHLNVAFWLLWLALFAFCFFNSYDDPSSLFYNQDKAYTPRFSAVRAREGDEFVRNLLLPDGQRQPNPNGLDADRRPPAELDALRPGPGAPLLCVGIPSINRTTEAFLAHTLATLADNLSPHERAAVRIAVLLADRRPQAHFAYGQPWLAALADEVLVYAGDDKDNSTAELLLPGGSGGKYRAVPWDVRGGGEDNRRGTGRVENMRMDHSVLVETCRRSGAPFFALVEDDVVTSRDWFRRLGAGLPEVDRRARSGRDDDGGGRDWVYLRLFYSEIFMGWNSEEWLTYMETIFLVYAVVLLVFLEVRKRLFKGPPPGSSSSARAPPAPGGGSLAAARSLHSGFLAALVFGLWVPALIALYFLAGRISVNRLMATVTPWGGRGGSGGVREMPRYGCCAQGLVFPERHLEGFQRLLRDPPYDFAGDQILEGWAGRMGLSKWALEPSVMQHVGLKESSEGPRRAEVWNFSFERQHKR